MSTAIQTYRSMRMEAWIKITRAWLLRSQEEPLEVIDAINDLLQNRPPPAPYWHAFCLKITADCYADLGPKHYETALVFSEQACAIYESIPIEQVVENMRPHWLRRQRYALRERAEIRELCLLKEQHMEEDMMWEAEEAAAGFGSDDEAQVNAGEDHQTHPQQATPNAFASSSAYGASFGTTEAGAVTSSKQSPRHIMNVTPASPIPRETAVPFRFLQTSPSLDPLGPAPSIVQTLPQFLESLPATSTPPVSPADGGSESGDDVDWTAIPAIRARYRTPSPNLVVRDSNAPLTPESAARSRHRRRASFPLGGSVPDRTTPGLRHGRHHSGSTTSSGPRSQVEHHLRALDLSSVHHSDGANVHHAVGDGGKGMTTSSTRNAATAQDHGSQAASSDIDGEELSDVGDIPWHDLTVEEEEEFADSIDRPIDMRDATERLFG